MKKLYPSTTFLKVAGGVCIPHIPPWICPCHKPKKIENHWTTSSEVLITKSLEGGRVSLLALPGTIRGFLHHNQILMLLLKKVIMTSKFHISPLKLDM